MTVERDGAGENIRIVRFRTPTAIEFFNPLPPPQMLAHRGTWHAKTQSSGQVELIATREFLFREAPEYDGAWQRGFVARFRRRLEAIVENAALALAEAMPAAAGGGGHGYQE